MNNYEIAHVFKLLADLLEIKGDNPFRIRSYRNAVEIMTPNTKVDNTCQ